MRSVDQGIAWAKSPAANLRDGKSWAGWCLSYVFRFIEASHSAETAILAYHASGPVQSKDPAKAPKGAIHWWSDSGAGHVAIAIDDHGTAAMASAAIDHAWGVAQGTITVAAYNAKKPALKYLGWTFDFLGQMTPDVIEHIKAETAKEQAAAAAAKAAKAAAAKAAADKVAAEKAAAEKAAAVTIAEQKAIADAVAAAQPNPEAQMYFPIAKEKGHPEYWLLIEGTQKTHITHEQWQVLYILGARVTEVPEGSLSAFKTVA